jgi:hypothetical protein
MDKYIVILSIIIVLYFAQKYCIKSEVETFLLTKNILEKFDETTGGLNILGNIRLANRHIISSESNGLAILNTTSTTTNLDYGNLKVKDINVTGTLIQSGTSNLPSSFTNSTQTARLNINSGTLPNSVDITSLNGPLILSGQNGPVTLASQNIIKISGNIDITGDVTINAAKPIVTRIVTIPSNSTTAITTDIDATDYPSITFSGFNNSTASSQSYAAAIEFNTSKGTDNKWYISFTPRPSSTINVRLTFFHKNLVQNDAVDSVVAVTIPNAPTNLSGIRTPTTVVLSWVVPSTGGSPITKYRLIVENGRVGMGGILVWSVVSTEIIDTITNSRYSYDNVSNRATYTIPWTVPLMSISYRFKVAAFNNIGYSNDSAYSGSFIL